MVNHFEDFEVGRRFRHRLGRTLTEAEAIEFATQHMLHEPQLFDRQVARHLGFRDLVVSPLFVFAIILGLSVEDLSESGGPFLGADGIEHLKTVHPGDTLYSSSVVLSRRPSKSRPSFGVVEWQTSGHDQDGQAVIRYRRSNLVRVRP